MLYIYQICQNLFYTFFSLYSRNTLSYTKMSFKNLSLIELDELIKAGKTTSEEVYTYFLERAKEYNSELNAFTTLPPDTPQ